MPLSPHKYCCCLPFGTSSSLSGCHWQVCSASHWLRLKCVVALESPGNTSACYNTDEFCLNTHSAAASWEEMFDCSLTRRANYMTATQCVRASLKMCWSLMWASQEGSILYYCWCQTGFCAEYFTDINTTIKRETDSCICVEGNGLLRSRVEGQDNGTSKRSERQQELK